MDNNSRDRTRDVVAECNRRYPGRFRYLFESKPGKSNALNRGIAEAQGDVLAFTDDDVTVEPLWLQELTDPLLKGEWAGCGGRVVAEWNCPPPRWMPDDNRYAWPPLAVFDLGLKAGQLTEAPFGANMAFRKDLFQKYGGFRADLGPGSSGEIRGEESDFANRLLAAGERLWYQPSALVYHPVLSNRLRKEYFLNWWCDKGRAVVRTHGLPTDAQLVVVGVPLRFLRRLAVWTGRWILAVGSSRRFSNKLKVWLVVGQILECYRQAHSARLEAQ